SPPAQGAHADLMQDLDEIGGRPFAFRVVIWNDYYFSAGEPREVGLLDGLRAVRPRHAHDGAWGIVECFAQPPARDRLDLVLPLNDKDDRVRLRGEALDPV